MVGMRLQLSYSESRRDMGSDLPIMHDATQCVAPSRSASENSKMLLHGIIS